MTDDERHEALRQLAEEWWEPPADLIDTLPKGGVELRYLSHIWVRKAFQDADPDWSWEPMGFDDRGQPVVERDSQGHPVGLWIWLNLLGTRMPGYGSVEPGKRDAIKELIGDALRNAGMRLVGGALWVKTKPKGKGVKTPRSPKGAGRSATPVDAAIEHLREQVDPPAPTPEEHSELAAGKAFYDRMVEAHTKDVVNGALATFKVSTFSELTPAKCKVIEASLLSRERLIKEENDRAHQLAKEQVSE